MAKFRIALVFSYIYLKHLEYNSWIAFEYTRNPLQVVLVSKHWFVQQNCVMPFVVHSNRVPNQETSREPYRHMQVHLHFLIKSTSYPVTFSLLNMQKYILSVYMQVYDHTKALAPTFKHLITCAFCYNMCALCYMLQYVKDFLCVSCQSGV